MHLVIVRIKEERSADHVRGALEGRLADARRRNGLINAGVLVLGSRSTQRDYTSKTKRTDGKRKRWRHTGGRGVRRQRKKRRVINLLHEDDKTPS